MSNSARLVVEARERAAVAETEARLWNSQGTIDPHDAAHVGRTVPAPVRPLAVFDPGISNFIGVSVFIEGHTQNPAQHRPMEGGTAISRFGGFSAAWTLQVIAPVIIILAGFATTSGEVARERFQLELGAGTSVTALIGGRLIALSLVAAMLVLVMIGVSLPAIGLQGAGVRELTALAAIGGFYLFYLFVFCALTVSASCLFRSARSALVFLLSFWMVSTLLLPRLAPAVAEWQEPTPSAPAFKSALIAEAGQGIDVHDPSDEGLKVFEADLLAHYDVSQIEDLPINFRGAKYEYGEALSTQLNNRYFDQLYDIYRSQEAVMRLFAILSPTISIQPWSHAFAGTDIQSHLLFLSEVEDYRYRLIQTLNQEIKKHKALPGERYRADIATVTRNVTFTSIPPSLNEVFAAQQCNLVILLAWVLFASILTIMSAYYLSRHL